MVQCVQQCSGSSGLWLTLRPTSTMIRLVVVVIGRAKKLSWPHWSFQNHDRLFLQFLWTRTSNLAKMIVHWAELWSWLERVWLITTSDHIGQHRATSDHIGLRGTTSEHIGQHRATWERIEPLRTMPSAENCWYSSCVIEAQTRWARFCGYILRLHNRPFVPRVADQCMPGLPRTSVITQSLSH